MKVEETMYRLVYYSTAWYTIDHDESSIYHVPYGTVRHWSDLVSI